MGLIRLEPGYQKIEETEFTRYIRREMGKPASQIVGYYVDDTKAHCVGIWRNRDAGYVQELIHAEVGKQFTASDAAFVRYMLSGERLRRAKWHKQMAWEAKVRREIEREAKAHEQAARAYALARKRVVFGPGAVGSC